MKFLSAKNMILGGALLTTTLPCHAVVLKQKWQAGQKLVYAVDLDGTANLQLPPDAPGAMFLGGAPLEVPMKGEGLASLDTLKVDEAGTGTVAVTLPQWKMSAQVPMPSILGQVLNQKMPVQWTLRDGKSQLSVNGQPVNLGIPQSDGKATQAVKIGTNGQFQGVEPIANPNKPATPTPAKIGDQSAAAVATILRAFPALWPARDVKVGDTWQANVDYPALARPAQNGEPAKPLGAFNLKLEGEDVTGGKTLQRVSIKGDIDLDGKTLETAFPPAPATPNAGGRTRPQPKLEHATETVEGTVWLDAGAGQVAKTALIIGGQAQGSTPKPNGQPGSKAWFDFTGTLNMALQPN